MDQWLVDQESVVQGGLRWHFLRSVGSALYVVGEFSQEWLFSVFRQDVIPSEHVHIWQSAFRRCG